MFEFSDGGSFEQIEPGKYDGYIIGIVGLSKQAYEYNGESKPRNRIKVVFELVDQKMENGMTVTKQKELTASTHEKGNLIKFYNTLMGTSVDSTEFADIIKSGKFNEQLLGKAVSVTMAAWDKNGKDMRMVSDVLPVDERIKITKGSRSTFSFNPTSPDMDIWNKEITHYTKETIMKSLNASKFPTELHKQWLLDQEAKETKGSDDKPVSKKSEADLGSIS